MPNLNILYEDNHLIVVEKKPNILSQSDSTGDIDLLTIIKQYIKKKYHKPGNVYVGLVHRLDRPVGGVMVFAKTSKAARRLNNQIQNNEMHKSYYAIVHGYLDKHEGIYEDLLEKKPDKSVVVNSKNGKQAKLEYQVLEQKDNLSLIKINLITGRYHQIRVQFASRNHPLYGDQLYGKKDNNQIALFAYKLSFKHPVSQEILNFELKPEGNIWQKFNI